MVNHIHIEAFQDGKEQVKDDQQQEKGKRLEVLFTNARTILQRQPARVKQNGFEGGKKLSFKMGDEVQAFLQEMTYGFIVIGVYLLATEVAEFSTEAVAAVFTSIGC